MPILMTLKTTMNLMGIWSRVWCKRPTVWASSIQVNKQQARTSIQMHSKEWNKKLPKYLQHQRLKRARTAKSKQTRMTGRLIWISLGTRWWQRWCKMRATRWQSTTRWSLISLKFAATLWQTRSNLVKLCHWTNMKWLSCVPALQPSRLSIEDCPT